MTLDGTNVSDTYIWTDFVPQMYPLNVSLPRRSPSAKYTNNVESSEYVLSQL